MSPPELEYAVLVAGHRSIGTSWRDRGQYCAVDLLMRVADEGGDGLGAASDCKELCGE